MLVPKNFLLARIFNSSYNNLCARTYVRTYVRRRMVPGPRPPPIPDRDRACMRILYREVTSSVPPLQCFALTEVRLEANPGRPGRRSQSRKINPAPLGPAPTPPFSENGGRRLPRSASGAYGSDPGVQLPGRPIPASRRPAGPLGEALGWPSAISN